jgi:hypothetical protein
MSDRRDPIDGVRRLDPIDGALVAAEWSSSDAKSALYQEITALPAQTFPSIGTTPRRTPPRRAALVAATLVVAALAIAGIGVLPEAGTAAYAVRHLPDGVLEVSWDGELDGEVLAATLREYHVDVHVETEPASPSLVGQVSGLGPLEQQGAAAFRWGEGTSTFTLDPTAFTGTFYILIERAAEPGERYAVAADAFAPGEVLSGLPCAVERPLRSETLAAHLDRLGQRPVWNILNGETFDGALPQGEVLHVHAVDPSTLEVTVRLDGDPTAADPSPYLAQVQEGRSDGC